MAIVRELEEVKDFDSIKTIAHDDKVLVIGENLKENYNTRNYYIIYYHFSLEKTYVKSFLQLEKSLNLDKDVFRNFISINDQGQIAIVARQKDNLYTNVYDRILVFNISTLKLQVNSFDFDPSKVSLDIMSIGGDILERINLINLFTLDVEINLISMNPYAPIFFYMFAASFLLLLLGILFYLVSNRIYKVQKA